jgi:hypothetical protein
MNKTLYIIIGILLLILLIYIIYKCAFSKQNFQVNKINNFKLKSKIKDNFKEIVEKERLRVEKELHKNSNKNSKFRALRNIESSDNGIDVQFKNILEQTAIGKSIYLNNCNFLQPRDVLEKSTYYIFKEQLPVGEIDSITGLSKIVKSNSYDNKQIEYSGLGRDLNTTLTTYESTEKIISKLSSSISGSIGGSFNQLSVNASFNYLTSTNSVTELNFQAVNYDVEKNTGFFMYKPDFYYKEENYTQEFLDEFIYLSDKEPDISLVPFTKFF